MKRRQLAAALAAAMLLTQIQPAYAFAASAGQGEYEELLSEEGMQEEILLEEEEADLQEDSVLDAQVLPEASASVEAETQADGESALGDADLIEDLSAEEAWEEAEDLEAVTEGDSSGISEPETDPADAPAQPEEDLPAEEEEKQTEEITEEAATEEAAEFGTELYDEEMPVAEEQLDETDLLDEEAAEEVQNAYESRVEYYPNWGDRDMLRGWEDHIDRWFHARVFNTDSDDYDMDAEVTDVLVTNPDGQKVLEVRKNEGTNDEGQPDWNWDVIARNHGEGIVTVKTNDIDGNPRPDETYHIWVVHDVYDLHVDTADGAYRYLPEAEVDLETQIWHHVQDAEDADTSNVTYEWKIPEEFAEDVRIISENGGTAKIKFRAETAEEKEDGLWKDIRIEVRAFEGVTEEGKPCEQAYTEIWLTLSNWYYDIYPTRIDSDLLLGQSIKDFKPELRLYRSGEDYEVLDNVYWRWEYDENQLLVEDEKGNKVGNYDETSGDYNGSEASAGSGRSFTITRTWRDWTDLNLIADYEREDGSPDEERRGFTFYNRDYNIWFDDGDNRNVYSDGNLQLTVNTGNLEGVDYKLTVEAGTWNHRAKEGEDPWITKIAEGNGWTLNGNTVTVDGKKLYALTGGEEGVNLHVSAMYGDKEFADTWCWLNVCEAREEYNLPQDRDLLKYWTDDIDSWVHVYVENTEHPDGWDTDVRMTDVSVRNEDPNPDLDPVLRIWKDEWTNNEGEPDWSWHIEGRNYGCGIVKYTYTDLHGKAQTGEYRLNVGSDVYDLDVYTADGAYRFLPGSEVELEANVRHHVQDMDDNDVDLSGVTYKWEVPEKFAEYVESITPNGNKAKIKFREETAEDKEYGLWEDIQIEVRAYEGKTEEGDPCERAYADTWVTLSNYYYEIVPFRMDEDLLIGKSIENFKPELRIYSAEDPEHYEVVEDVSWRWEYDKNNLLVKDEKGNQVGNYTLKGVDADGNEDWEYNGSEESNGAGRTFTITRTWKDGTCLNLIADYQEENGEWRDERRDFWFHGPDYNIWFEDGDWHRVFTNGTSTFKLNIQELDGIDSQVKIEAGDWNDEEEKWNATWTNGWSFDQKTGEFTVDGKALKNAGRDSMQVRVRVYVDTREEELNETWGYFDVNDADWWNGPIGSDQLFPNEERYLAIDDGSRVQGHDSFFPDDNWIRLRVKDVRVVSDPDEQDSRDAVTVEKQDDGWLFKAIRPGHAEATATFELFRDGEFEEDADGKITASSKPVEEIEYTWEFWVGDFRAYINLFGKDGTDRMMSGTSYTLSSMVFADAYEWDGDYGHPIDTERYKVQFDDVWIENIDDNWEGWNWEKAEGKDQIDLQTEDGSKKASITWKQQGSELVLTADREVPNLEIRVHAAAYDHDDENPEEIWEIAASDHSVWVDKRLYKIVLVDESGKDYQWDTHYLPGTEQMVDAKLYFYNSPEDPGTEVTDPGLFFRWEWYEGGGEDDPSHLIITDADGKVLTHSIDGGTIGKAPFRLKRMITWGGSEWLAACGIDENGNEFEYASMAFGLDNVQPEITFKHDHPDRGNRGYTYFYVNEPVKVTLDTTQIRPILEQYPGQAQLLVTAGLPDENDVLQPIVRYKYNEAEDKWDENGVFTFTSGELTGEGNTPGLDLSAWSEDQVKELVSSLNQQYRGDFQIRAIFQSADQVITEERFDVQIRWLQRDPGLPPETVTGELFAHEDNKLWLYVEDPEHSGSEDNGMPGKWYGCNIEKIELMDPSESDQFEILSPDQAPDGVWSVRGLKPGETGITYTVTGYPENSTEPFPVDWYWNVKDTVYHLELHDKNGTRLEEGTEFPIFPDQAITVYPRLIRYTEEKPDGEVLTSKDMDKDLASVQFDLEADWRSSGRIEEGSLEAFNEDWSKGITLVGRSRGNFSIYPVAYLKFTGSDEEHRIEPAFGWYRIEVQTAYGTLDLSGQELYVTPGQVVKPEELQSMASGKFTGYSMKNPAGVTGDPTRLWFDYADPDTGVEIEPDQYGCAWEMKISEDALKHLEEGKKVYETGVHVGAHGSSDIYGGGWLKLLVHAHDMVKTAAKAPTYTSDGNIEYWTCSLCGKIYKDEAGKTEITLKDTVLAKIPNPEGDPKDPASITATEQKVAAVKDSGEPDGSSFAKIQVQSTKQSKNSITIKWNKVAGAAGYIVYGAQRGNANKLKRIIKITNPGTVSYAWKSLKADTYYKFVVVAYQKAGSAEKQLAVSKLHYAATTSKKFTNVSKVTVKAKKVTLKKNKTSKISAKQVLAKKKMKLTNCKKLRYESSNPSVATVDKNGKIKAKKAGKCTIFVYSQNGTFAKVTVTVKK